MMLPMMAIFSVVALWFPYFAPYCESIGLHKSEIMILTGVGPLVAIMFQQFWGYVADAILGRRMTFMALSVVCTVIMSSFLWVTSFYGLLLLVGVLSAFSNPRVPMASALILGSKGGRGIYGVMRAVGTYSFIVVLFFGGWMADRHGVAVIFILLIIANAVCAASVLPVREKPVARALDIGAEPPPSFMAVQRLLLGKPLVRWFLLFTVVMNIPHGASVILQSLFIKELGGDNTHIAWALGIGAVAESVVFLMFAVLRRRMSLMTMFLVGSMASVVRWLIICAVPTLNMVLLTNVLHLFTFGLLHMSSVVLIDEELPPRFRTSAQSLLGIVTLTAGTAMGPFLSAGFFALFGEGALRAWFGAAGVLSLAALPVWFAMRRHAHTPPPDTPPYEEPVPQSCRDPEGLRLPMPNTTS